MAPDAGAMTGWTYTFNTETFLVARRRKAGRGRGS